MTEAAFPPHVTANMDQALAYAAEALDQIVDVTATMEREHGRDRSLMACMVAVQDMGGPYMATLLVLAIRRLAAQHDGGGDEADRA